MNITLIGMPGTGKSFLGKLLAKKLNMNFIDIDRIIEKKDGKKLQDILDILGDKEFIKREEKEVLNLGIVTNTIISTGGSVVYSRKSMELLKKISKIIYLKSELKILEYRINNLNSRGIVGIKNKGLKKLFLERDKLFKKYADFTVNTSRNNPKIIINNILNSLVIRGNFKQ